jgi:hypothetical protein
MRAEQGLGSAVLAAVVGAFGCCPPAPAPASPPAPALASASSSPEGTPRAVVRRENQLIEFGPYALEIDPTDGGRIVAFSLDGRNVVVPKEESPEAYGSSFWPSPQSDWRWPPPLEWDRRAWKVSVEDRSLVLQSGQAPKLGLSARQRFTADVAHGAVSIELTITNGGTAPRRVAPWQNTRVRPRGLTFYPSSGATLPDSSLKLEPVGGIIWFAHDPAAFKESKKSYSDSEEGWVARVDGELLFVKVFSDVPRERIAPGEGEVVLYVHDGGLFVEVEQQGPYVELAPGASSTWPLHWLVRKLPLGMAARPGNTELVEFVRTLVASVR